MELECIAIKHFLPVCAAWEIVRFKAILIIFARATFFLENENEKVNKNTNFNYLYHVFFITNAEFMLSECDHKNDKMWEICCSPYPRTYSH